MAAAAAGAALGAAGAADAAGRIGWAAAVGGVTGVAGAVVGVIDVRDRRVPNVVVLATSIAAVLLGMLVLAVDARQVFGGFVAGGLVAGAPLLIVHLVSPQGMGFGDVKYGTALGGLLGVLDWRLAVVAVMVSSLAGGTVGLAYAPWRRSIPFGLFLSVGALVALSTARLQP